MSKKQAQKTADDYLKSPYTIEVFRDAVDDESGWVARVVELPGCLTQGDTIVEMAEMLDDAMRTWIASALADGDPIPEPRPLTDYSGKFVARVPRSLHRELVQAASCDGVRLNAFVNMALSKAVAQTTQHG
ncbi:MAG: type II toxin-antitoxin system HicB family antitoxin [Chloroflexi bacterium]|nr:MAG: type II toxin-antitoxin system HicB family antitoxin [Chloroflexota bacterium]